MERRCPMAQRQDQKPEKLHSDQDKERLHPKVDSGDESGQGRERRDDTDVYPQKRGTGDFGTHGGPNKHETKLDAPSRTQSDE
jgi:hypothetical protein